MDIIRVLLPIENIMGVYRNYLSIKKKAKNFAKLRILIEIGLMLIVQVYFVTYILRGYVTHKIWKLSPVCVFFFVLISTISSLAALVLSFCKAYNFKEFTFNVDTIYKLYENDPSFQRFLKKQWRRFYIDVTLFTAAMISVTLNFITEFLSLTLAKIMMMHFIVLSLQEYRYFYENFIFFQFIEIIVVPLKFLNEVVTAAVEKIDGEQRDVENNRDMENKRELQGICDGLEKMGKASRLLVAASDSLGDCFGVQITISLCSATLCYIIFLYQCITYLIDQKYISSIHFGSTVFYLICYILLKILIVAAGQRAQNEAENLQKNLYALRSLLMAGADAANCARAAAGLARRLRAAPLRVRLLSPLAVQMALLADIFALVANYTIVLLQFNHVV